ncbi:hypothetical protein GCM10011380_10550 [Sphingomonas metalli]|uniref:TIR domain-containing protein n=1 Tax=Sphingomonas metalli TaxID=1779358 RepID=A0A916SYZ3_9SPHN|nr:TIR domain-containing protein [Sphingomonas metalli]GGB22779.1 hypothetical protein GCM10011380_10550 [Sphingomonas metalli]
MTDLFVSYKSEDRARVAPLVAALEADGISVWWDTHIGSGSSWRESIETNLSRAGCVLVVWSERSVGSEGSFVRDEATRSLRRGTYLPVRIDPVEPPLGFGETQAASLIGWRGDRKDPRYLEVLGAARAVLAGTPRPSPQAYQAKRGLDRRLVIGGSVAAVAAAGAGGWWALHRQGAPGDSVAVLPFENLSGDPTQAYFSDGIAEELRDALTRIASLKVAARTSSELMRDADVATAAAKLGVANILTGSVRRGSGTLRINAQLVDGVSGLTRWSEAYTRPIGDALAIQTGIAESVASALSITLGGVQKALLAVGGTNNPRARDAYLQGVELVRKNENERAIELLNAAIAADPNFAKPYASRADARVIIAAKSLGGGALRAELTNAEADARRAISLAPNWGPALSALGAVLENRLDLRGAASAFDAALKASANDAVVLRKAANFLARQGNREAIALYSRLEASDPLRARNPISRAAMLVNLGLFDDAITSAQAGLASFPNDPPALYALALAQLAKGQPVEALKAAKRIPPELPFGPAYVAAATATTDRAASDRALKELIDNHSDNAQYQIAEAHSWRGEKDAAFQALGRAWDALDPGLANLKTDPLLVPIRSDPRFGEWPRKIGFS